MSELKLEVGKSYRTRSGEKVEITDKQSGVKLLFTGVFEDGRRETYRVDGSCFFTFKSLNDLIVEWEDEPKIHFEQPMPNFPKGGSNTKESILQEAERIINGDRQETYGDSKTMFENIAAGWAVIFKDGVTPKRVSLAMIWLKICRENNKHGRDNLVDISGYAALIEKI